MDKKLIKTLIAIWSIIAIGLTGVLLYGIISGKGINNFFGTLKYSFDSSLIVQKEENIELNNLNKINIEFSSSEILVKDTDESNIKVIQKSTGDLDDNEKFIVDEKDNEIILKRNNSHKYFSIFNLRNLNQRVEVYIPKSYNKDLLVYSSSGNIDLNLNTSLNEISCTASSGNISMGTDINANDINIKASSGNINLESLVSKNYNINSSSGNININSLAGSGEIKSSSGNVKINYKDIDEYSNVSAHSGNIRLTVPDGLNFEFNGQCSSGDIKSNFDLNFKDKKGNKAIAQIGSNPYKKLDAKTSSGNINISK